MFWGLVVAAAGRAISRSVIFCGFLWFCVVWVPAAGRTVIFWCFFVVFMGIFVVSGD
jgi:hypothetical protein